MFVYSLFTILAHISLNSNPLIFRYDRVFPEGVFTKYKETTLNICGRLCQLFFNYFPFVEAENKRTISVILDMRYLEMVLDWHLHLNSTP